MVKLNIGGGQGMTQAIASNLNLSEADKKKINLSTWQQVMSLVDGGASKTKDGGSIFGNQHDASKVGNKTYNKSNFLVKEGQQVEIDNSIWSKITQLLTGKAPVNAPQLETLKAPSTGLEIPAPVKTAAIPNTSSQAVANTSGIVKAQTPVMIANTPEGGDVKTGEKINNSFKAMMENPTNKAADITVTSDEWRTLANKKDLKPEEYKKLASEYNDGMKKLGGSYSKFLSQKYGDNSGKLDEAAFMKFQNDGVPQEMQADLADSNKIAFKRLDLDGDGKISEKEMSAYMMALDYGPNGGVNGVIDEKSVYENAPLLSDPGENNVLDKKLAASYKALYGGEENN